MNIRRILAALAIAALGIVPIYANDTVWDRTDSTQASCLRTTPGPC